MADNDVTDDDRKAREWASSPARQSNGLLAPVARAILAHVPAPPATLADELRDICKKYSGDVEVDLEPLADRADELEERARQVESLRDRGVALVHERDEARASLKRERASLKRESEARSQWMEFCRKAEDEVRDLTAEVERLTSGRPTRAIEQAECLDKFQVGTVGRTAQTLEAWQRDVYGWNSTNRTGDFASKDIIERFGPMTILYSPEVSE